MSMAFKTFAEFEDWRRQNSVEMTDEQLSEIRSQLNGTDDAMPQEQKRKSNPLLTFFGVMLLIISGIRIMCAVLKKVFL